MLFSNKNSLKQNKHHSNQARNHDDADDTMHWDLDPVEKEPSDPEDKNEMHFLDNEYFTLQTQENPQQSTAFEDWINLLLH